MNDVLKDEYMRYYNSLQKRLDIFNKTHETEEKIDCTKVKNNDPNAIGLLLDMCEIDDELEKLDDKTDNASVAKRDKLNNEMRELLFGRLDVIFNTLYSHIYMVEEQNNNY